MNSHMDLQFAPLVDDTTLIALAGLSLVILAFSAFAKLNSVGYRFLILAGLFFLLVNPTFVTENRQYLKDTVLVITDQTDSQKYGNRLDQTNEAFAQIQKEIASYPNLELKTATAKTPLSLEAGAPGGSRLFEERFRLLQSLSPNEIAATIFITDGQVHDVPDQSNAGPIHVLVSGDDNEKDRVLLIENAPAYGIVNKEVTLKIKVLDHGVSENSTLVATIKTDDKQIRRVAVRTGQVTEIPVFISHGGDNFVEISLPKLEGELSEKNNKAFLSINGIRDRLKVLLVSGEPHMGERGWRNILKSDPAVDLVHFTILRPPEKQDGTPINELSLIPFPITELFERKLDEFDLIIFDRYRRRGVLAPNYLKNIVEYVENGGALLEAAGPAFATPLSLYRTPLSEVLPGRPTGLVYQEGYVPALNTNGTRHPVTSSLGSQTEREKWGRWFRMIEADVSGGDILMTGPSDQPLLVLERHGEGRVAQLLSDHAWLWGHGFEGGGPQGELLKRVSHWLMQEQELEEEQLTAQARGNTLEIERRSLEAGEKIATVQDPDGTVHTITLEYIGAGLNKGQFEITSQGLYLLRSGGLTTRVAVGRLNPLESRDIRSTKEVLSPIAEKSGGGIYRIAEKGIPSFRRTSPENSQSGSNWMGLRNNGNYEVVGYNRTSLTPPLIALLVLSLLLGLAWWRESK